jgi:hypothetical protein
VAASHEECRPTDLRLVAVNFRIKLWHKHMWSEWDRAWGKGSPKGYVLERKCLICGKLETNVLR